MNPAEYDEEVEDVGEEERSASADLLEPRCIGTTLWATSSGEIGDWKLLCDGVLASKMEAEVGGKWGGIWRGGR